MGKITFNGKIKLIELSQLFVPLSRKYLSSQKINLSLS